MTVLANVDAVAAEEPEILDHAAFVCGWPQRMQWIVPIRTGSRRAVRPARRFLIHRDAESVPRSNISSGLSPGEFPKLTRCTW